MPMTRLSCVCRTVVALCCIVGPAIAQDQQGPAIAAVRVQGLRNVAEKAVLETVKDSLVVGKPFGALQAQATQDALMATGWFVSVKVATEQAAEGAVVVVAAVESPVASKTATPIGVASPLSQNLSRTAVAHTCS